MNVTFSTIDHGSYEEVCIKGAPSGTTMIEYIGSYSGQRKSKRTLWNFVEADVSAIEPTMYKKIAAFLLESDPATISEKSALLFRDDFDSILGNAYEAFTTAVNLSIAYGSFVNRDEAIRWLSE